MKLIFFTNAFPYGMGVQWKFNELKELQKHFTEVLIVPFCFGGNQLPTEVPENVTVAKPIFEREKKIRKVDFLEILFNKSLPYFLREFFYKKVYCSKSRFVSWAIGSLQIIRLRRNRQLRQVLSRIDKKTVLYFYWGKGACDILPLLDSEKYYKSLVRMHGYDLYEYRNNNYIPYRAQLLKSATVIGPCSEAGKDHLVNLYPGYKNKIKVLRVGTISRGEISKPSTDNILRVVSCSILTDLKRVHIMVEALRYFPYPIIWKHIGDGPVKASVEELIIQFKLENKFFLEGFVNPKNVMHFYLENKVDLFVNVSSTEGVPVSIMEAYAAGIPVMATDVGGTSEIVSNKRGKLIEADVTPKNLAYHLQEFYSLPTETKQRMRFEARKEYEKNWNIRNISRTIIEELS